MRCILTYCLLTVVVLCSSTFLAAQFSKVIPNEDALGIVLDEVISRDLYLDSLKELKVAIDFKIDSLGEVNSAHIRWSNNLGCEKYYPICREIEQDVRLKFVYDKYKDQLMGVKYVFWTYPYFSDREQLYKQ